MSAPASISGSCFSNRSGSADVVGVHPGDDLVLAGRQPGVERRAEADVVGQLDVGAPAPGWSRPGAAISVGQLLGHRPVLDEHHLGGPAGLLVRRVETKAARR